VTVKANSAAPYYPYSTYTWTLTAFDSYTTYTVGASSGSISRTDETITLTMGTPGAVTMTINGRSIPLTVAVPNGFVQRITGTNFGGGGGYVATDSSGNCYFLTTSTNAANDLALLKVDQYGQFIWQTGLGLLASSDTVSNVQIASSGNVYISGTTQVAGGNAALLAKYDSAGVLQWQRTYYESSTPIRVFGGGIFIDSSENVYQVCLAATGVNAILISYTSAGVFSTVRSFQAIAPEQFQPSYVYVDGSGNQYMGGSGRGGTGQYGALFTKGNPGLSIVACWSGGAGSQQGGVDIKADSAGNIFIALSYYDGGSNYSSTLLKLNTSGTVLWQRRYVNGSNRANAIAVDTSNNVYLLTPGTITKYNSSGTLQWQRSSNQSMTSITWASGKLFIGSSIGVLKVPDDGTATGSYTVGGSTFTYAVATGTDSAGSATNDPLFSVGVGPAVAASAAGTLVASAPGYVSNLLNF
jgi:hypothetical protein